MILGIDSSAISAGCALMDDSGRIIAEQFLNISIRIRRRCSR